MSLPDSVRAAIVDGFGSDHVAEVELMLPSLDHLPPNPPYERVLLAILGLSEGRLDKLSTYSRSAMEDWRDVLFWWETPEEAAASEDHRGRPESDSGASDER